MNTQRIKKISQKLGFHILPVKPGHYIEIHETVGEGNNIRTWRFKGLVIKVNKKNQADGTFTVRGKAAGHTIEKIYPLSFTKFEKVLVLDIYKVRRAKLYFIRDKVGKAAKFQSIATAEEKGVDLLELAKSNVVPREEDVVDEIESSESEIDAVIEQAEEQTEEQAEEQTEEQAEEQTEEQAEEQTEEQAEEQTEEQVEEQTEEQAEEQTEEQAEEQTEEQA